MTICLMSGGGPRLEVDQIVTAIVDRHVAAALESVAVAVEPPRDYDDAAHLAADIEALRSGDRPATQAARSSPPTSRPPPPSGTTEGGDGTKQQARRVEPTGRRWNTYERRVRMSNEVNIPLLRKAVEWAEAEATKPEIDREWDQSNWVNAPEPSEDSHGLQRRHHEGFALAGRSPIRSPPTAGPPTASPATSGNCSTRLCANERGRGVEVEEFAAAALGI